MQDGNSFTPWYNFPLIEFLNDYIRPNMNIFEYGCGFSTLYYAQKKCNVYAVESNHKWIEKISHITQEHNLESLINITQCKANEMPKQVHQFNVNFDIIVIDSHRRLECLMEAKKTNCKMIILDNSEREKLQQANNVMQEFEMKVFVGNGTNREGTSEAKVFLRSL
jgi:precorrin-6B methylase 2